VVVVPTIPAPSAEATTAATEASSTPTAIVEGAAAKPSATATVKSSAASPTFTAFTVVPVHLVQPDKAPLTKGVQLDRHRKRWFLGCVVPRFFE
jgi:hypothetical protein